MRLPRRDAVLLPRTNVGRGTNEALIIAVVFVGLLVVALFSYLLLRQCRKSRSEPPSWLPLSIQRRWRAWTPGMYTSPGPTPRHPSTRSSRRNRHNPPAAASAGVDRNTSVRSVMTLPEYRPIAAADRERTIGREGERAGIDVVIEYPETVDEEESRREDHMQTLYEIRLARQLERAVARESALADGERPGSSGSTVRLVQPEGGASTSQLMAALASITERERRLSKVQYAEIGVARHDGTRIRPSMDSDRGPLLQDGGAPSIRSNSHGRSGSGVSVGTPERRRSDEMYRMNSARPSADHHRAESQDRLLAPPEPSETPAPEYDGSQWGEPPEYTSPIEPRGNGADELPVLRIDTGTPSPAASARGSPTIRVVR